MSVTPRRESHELDRVLKLSLEAVALYKDLLGPSKCETLPGKLNYTMVLDSTNAAYMVSICLHRIKGWGRGKRNRAKIPSNSKGAIL